MRIPLEVQNYNQAVIALEKLEPKFQAAKVQVKVARAVVKVLERNIESCLFGEVRAQLALDLFHAGVNLGAAQKALEPLSNERRKLMSTIRRNKRKIRVRTCEARAQLEKLW